MGETRWVTVFEGKPSRLEVLRGRLETEGIPTFVPDQLTKTVDPFITGGNALDYRLQVPEPDAERAATILATPVVRSDEHEEDDDEEEDTPQDLVELSAIRTMWLTLLLLTTPIAVVSGLFYFRDVRRHGVRSRNHALVVTSWLISVVFVCLAIVGPLLLDGRRHRPSRFSRPEPPPAPGFPYR